MRLIEIHPDGQALIRQARDLYNLALANWLSDPRQSQNSPESNRHRKARLEQFERVRAEAEQLVISGWRMRLGFDWKMHYSHPQNPPILFVPISDFQAGLVLYAFYRCVYEHNQMPEICP